MSGLRLGARAGLGGVASWKTAGTTTSDRPPSSVTDAAFGPGFTAAGPTSADVLKPNDGFGIALWVGVGAIVALVLIRRSLPS